MWQVNTFSIFDLMGLLSLVGLAVVFYLSYWRLGRSPLDLTFANLLALGAFCCLMNFLQDNIVPHGTPSAGVPDASQLSFWLMRLMYVAGFIYMPISIRFVQGFTRTRGTIRRHVLWTYVVFALLIPLVFLPDFLRPRLEPLAAKSDWAHAFPWNPVLGALVLVQLAAWAGSQAYCQWLFHRHIRSLRRARDGACRRAKTVRLAFLVQVGGVMVDVAASAAGYAGVAMFPVTSIIMAVLIAATILRDRIDSERSQHRLAQELDLASRIQLGLLPKPTDAVCGFELTGWNQQAAQVGGDLYDYLCMPDGRWVILLADASGHGMGPALQVAETRAALRAAAMLKPQDPAKVLQVANSLLSKDMQEGNFVTCFVGFLDPLERTLQYASAGHGPMIFYDRRRNTFTTFNATATPLGVLEDFEFSPEVLERQFSPGDFVLVVSDGILEACDAEGNQFGVDRVMDALRAHLGRNPGDILAALRESLALFTGRQHHADDLTALFLRSRTAAGVAPA